MRCRRSLRCATSSTETTVLGSGELVRALHRAGLVDEYVLQIHPIALGSGQRLFGDSDRASLTLQRSVATTTGVLIAQYVVERCPSRRLRARRGRRLQRGDQFGVRAPNCEDASRARTACRSGRRSSRRVCGCRAARGRSRPVLRRSG
ncbi:MULTISPECIES: dihydrofolate reductase family protein [unclassified Rathayibacter]|uniref:dihydrofolate reductase family protein n=1 Tax=unclassified Rathayibacter TaxID=2609250 RepID=UPI001E4E42DC|nr:MULTISPECIES: dihydrofolate reductase family protein [unclassified Rathayibacter]